jgi:hypothetical protein
MKKCRILFEWPTLRLLNQVPMNSDQIRPPHSLKGVQSSGLALPLFSAVFGRIPTQLIVWHNLNWVCKQSSCRRYAESGRGKCPCLSVISRVRSKCPNWSTA